MYGSCMYNHEGRLKSGQGPFGGVIGWFWRAQRGKYRWRRALVVLFELQEVWMGLKWKGWTFRLCGLMHLIRDGFGL